MVLVVAGCKPAAPAVDGPAEITTPAVVAKYQCNRCHQARGKLTPAPREQHCVDCHVAIRNGTFDQEYDANVVAGWRDRVHSLLVVPTLTGVSKRLRRDWFVAFLRTPHKVRPKLAASMPRLPIGTAEAEAIADYFYGSRPAKLAPTPGLGDPARGAALVRQKRCGDCHSFTGAAGFAPEGPPPDGFKADPLAPDLRFARRRMEPATLLAWLDAPKRLKPDTTMPAPGWNPTEQAAVAAFILSTPLIPPTPPAPLSVPRLERAVTYAEVSARVFRKVCWHCHSNAEDAGGDGGPGNTGGFGFAGAGLELAFYGPIVAAIQGGVDLPGRMRARHAEVAGHPTTLLGMPLGLAPFPPEDIALVEAWIRQGMPFL